MQGDAGRGGGNLQRRDRVGEAQPVDVDELEHGSFGRSQQLCLLQQAACLPFGVDLGDRPLEAVRVELPATAEPTVGDALPGVPPQRVGDDRARDPEGPSDRTASGRVVPVAPVDDRDEHVGCQVGSAVRIVDPPRDEPPYFVDVLAVEAIEQIWIPSEPCAVTVQARTCRATLRYKTGRC